MISLFMKRHVLHLYKVQAWQTMQQTSRMFVCPARRSPCGRPSSSVVLQAGSWWHSSRQTAGSPRDLRSLHCCAPRFQQKRRQSEEPQSRELDLLRYDMKDLMKAPKPALYLGFSGLIPFVSAPLFMALTEFFYPEIAYAQVAYGACILSFVGGARWGYALPEGSPAKPDWLNLANSVVPSLLAWVALLFKDNVTEASLMVIMGLGIALHYDLALLPSYPSWFKALRTVLTLVATFSLVTMLILKGVYPEKKTSADQLS